MKKQSGFTLIELITVILILGLLATVAVPLYIDFRSKAALANVEGVGAAISSASFMNWDAELTGGPAAPVTSCDARNLLESDPSVAGGLQAPQGYTYTFSPNTLTDGQTSTCTITITSNTDSSITQSFNYLVKGAVGIPASAPVVTP